jgi:hypothetical protein
MSNVVSGYRIVGDTMAEGNLLLLLCDHIHQKGVCCSNHVVVITSGGRFVVDATISVLD